MAYAYKRSLTIDHTQCGSSDTSNFAVLIKLDSSNAGTTLKTVGNGGHIQNTVTQSGGNAVTMPADLIFTSDSGGTTKLPWEVDFYDGTNGVLWAWVQVSTLSHSSNTVLYVFYDDATVSTQQNTGSYSPANVWNSNFQVVYHYPNGSSLSLSDSTAQGNNMSNNGSTAVAGQIDGGAGFSGSSQYQQTSATNFSTSGQKNISFWFKVSNPSPTQNFVMVYDGSSSDGISAVISGGIIAIGNYNDNTGWQSSTVSITDSNWHYVVGQTTGGSGYYSINVFVDGVECNSNSGAYNFSSTQASGITIGTWPYNTATRLLNGSMDEFRYADSWESADQITAEYNNQNNPESFVTAGSETSLGSSFIARIGLKILQAINRSNTY